MGYKDGLYVGSKWIHKEEQYEIEIFEVEGVREYAYVMYKKTGTNNCVANKTDVFLQTFEPKED